METNYEIVIRTSLEKRGFQYLEMVTTSEDIDKCSIKYKCKCGKEESREWNMLKKVGICGRCLSDIKIAANDEKIKAYGKSKGFTVNNIVRTLGKHKTEAEILYTCKCGKDDSVMMPTFKKTEFKGCESCKLALLDEEHKKRAKDRGFEIVDIRRNRKNDHTYTVVDVLCKCGVECKDVKLETCNSDVFKGCGKCMNEAKSISIKKTLSGGKKSVVESMAESLTSSGYTDIKMSGTASKTCVFTYLCKCENKTPVSKTYISVKNNPLCSDCINKSRKDNTNTEIANLLKSKGYTYISVRRDETDKSRIYVTFKCSCKHNEINERQWEVIRRDEFKGCRTCFNAYNVEAVSRLSHSDSVNEKRQNTNMERYGGVSSLSSNEIREKGKETMMLLYGVNNPSQSPQIHVDQHEFKTYISKSGKEYKYQGYEDFALKKFIEKDKMKEDNIMTCHELCSKDMMPLFEYITDDGKKHVYFPDIRIIDNNGNFVFVEVKSSTDAHSVNLELKIKSVNDAGYAIRTMKFNRIGSLINHEVRSPPYKPK